MSDIDKLENLDRLRRLPPSEDSFECQGCGRLDTRCTCSETLANAAPALLAEVRRLRAMLPKLLALLEVARKWEDGLASPMELALAVLDVDDPPHKKET